VKEMKTIKENEAKHQGRGKDIMSTRNEFQNVSHTLNVPDSIPGHQQWGSTKEFSANSHISSLFRQL
jgi:hypothetical protein